MGMFDDDEEFKALKAEQEGADKKKAYLGVAGNVLQGLSDAPSAYEIFTKTQSKRPDVKGMFGAVSDTIKDSMETKGKAFAYMKAKREQAQAQAADDPTHGDASSYRAQIETLAPSLKGKLEGMTLAQMERASPILMAKIKGDIERDNARTAAGQRAAEQAERRADRQETQAARLAEQERKNKELSVAQGKQRGLYEMGKKAEEQYSKATSDPKEYDPTGVGQIIDNSEWAPNWMKNNKAIEAQSAQSAWVESYLRDASGAAIPPSERGAYAKDFFPQPGDTKEVVANKAALRQQKMQNARMTAGLDEEPTQVQAAQAPAPSGTVIKTAVQEEKARRARLKNTAGN